MSSKFKIFLFIVLALVIGFGGGLYFGYKNLSPSKITANPQRELVTTQGQPKISIMVDFEDGTVKTMNDIEVNNNANLLDTMKNAFATTNIPLEYKEYAGLGALVTKIGDKSNGTGTSYWQYWVNNKRPDVGASSYQPKNGDIIEWKFLPDQGF
ncbi:hypothetical protein A2936_00795 [Candidatus Uhrbacteria bacterium RIFCSPLOWO2_01_FULL_47_25]|uniref:Transcobalamin-like C-terminal domain-containing protein n=1 Tax=Candidatus Uhrbacteria bacterium RIFCSPLOWO2_01_FULL_47_25 TaxID=1802402 RepID=A0A1F7US46_9BACT|nr:MAG: hypothetical protein A2936_00795 [Candidatus Uhrbacteria bacterium RIFCSPLOWO2_01_FULL_47_25]